MSDPDHLAYDALTLVRERLGDDAGLLVLVQLDAETGAMAVELNRVHIPMVISALRGLLTRLEDAATNMQEAPCQKH